MQKSNGLTSTMSRHSKSSDTKLLTSLLYLRKHLNKTIWEVHKLHWRQKKKIELQFSMFCLWLNVSDFCSLTKQCTRITTLGASNCRNTLLQINRKDLSCFVNYPSDAQLVTSWVQEKVQTAWQVLQQLASDRKPEAP